MTYLKPELLSADAALVAIQNTGKGELYEADDPVDRTTEPAYEVDE